MRPVLTLLAAILVAAPLSVSMADSADVAGPDVLAVAKASGRFSTLTQAIEAAGLSETLRSHGPITLFAPTNEAFAKLPPAELQSLMQPENKDKLAKILGLHVISSAALDSETLKRRSNADTTQGPVDVELKRGRLRVGDARVVGDDIKASNGIIHAIDKVILPTG